MHAEAELMSGDAKGKVDGESEPGAKNVLRDVTRISADGDHFAVRHVDDAHQAEGDGEAERDHQQNGAEAEAAKNGAEEIDPPNVLFN